MIYRFFRRKRVFAVLLVTFLLLLFYNSHWISMRMYPIKYEDDIRASSEEHHVNPFLIAAIVRVESNYKPDKVSAKGAVGLMQIMPDTAEWIAGQAGMEDAAIDRLADPKMNIHMGTYYVRQLLDRFGVQPSPEQTGADYALVAAAYNAGPGAVSRWLESGEWDGSYAQSAKIPYGETRHFVERIVYYYNKYQRYYADHW